MRVIAGELKGRRLVAPRLSGLRPTSDRAREAMFDALDARGLVEGSDVLDLFAGSGALGIEALSRGAASVIFVESHGVAVKAIRANLEAVGLGTASSAKVVQAEVLGWLGGAAGGLLGGIAIADPPYRFEDWSRLLELLSRRVRFVMLEHARPLEVGPVFETLRLYRHGGTLLTLAERQAELS